MSCLSTTDINEEEDTAIINTPKPKPKPKAETNAQGIHQPMGIFCARVYHSKLIAHFVG